MAHTPVDPSPQASTLLEVLEGEAKVFEALFIQPGRGAAGINRRAAQAFDSDEQTAFGNGRSIVGETTVDVIIEPSDTATAEQRLYALHEALKTATAIRYDGITRAIVGSAGITAWQHVGTANIRATITYFGQFTYAVDEADARQIGPV